MESVASEDSKVRSSIVNCRAYGISKEMRSNGCWISTIMVMLIHTIFLVRTVDTVGFAVALLLSSETPGDHTRLVTVGRIAVCYIKDRTA